jgi:hypothetical protein
MLLLVVAVLESEVMLSFSSHYLSTENSGLCLKVDSCLNVFGNFCCQKHAKVSLKHHS